VFWGAGPKERPWEEASVSVTVTDPGVKVNHAWFRGAWFDALTIAWKDVHDGGVVDRAPVTEGGPPPGASLFVPIKLKPGESKTVTLHLAWSSGQSNLHFGDDPKAESSRKVSLGNYKPWYAGKFANVEEVARYWRDNYVDLRSKSKRFSDCFYDSTLP